MLDDCGQEIVVPTPEVESPQEKIGRDGIVEHA